MTLSGKGFWVQQARVLSTKTNNLSINEGKNEILNEKDYLIRLCERFSLYFFYSLTIITLYRVVPVHYADYVLRTRAP